MKAAALTAIAIALLVSGEAAAQNFCSVTNNGREDCRFNTLEACRDHVGALGGFCVYRANAPGAAPGGRATADVAGSFQQGVDAAERRRFETESRELQLERQRLENERLQTVQSQPAAQQIPEGIEVAMEVCVALQNRFMQENEYEVARPYIEAFQICMGIVDPHVPADK